MTTDQSNQPRAGEGAVERLDRLAQALRDFAVTRAIGAIYAEGFEHDRDYAVSSDLREVLAQLAASQSREAELRAVLKELCDQIGDTETHGDGAHDDGCSVCIAHADARQLLATGEP